VCDYRTAQRLGLGGILAGIGIHLLYRGSKPLLQAATQAARDLHPLRYNGGALKVSGMVGTPLSASAAVVGGTLPLTLTVGTDGTVPPWLGLSGSGRTVTVSGTPSASGSWEFDILVEDARGSDVTIPVTITVTSKNGLQWRESVLPAQFGFDNNGSVVCPSAAVCYVPGNAEQVDGAFATTNNAAKSWSDYQLSGGSGTTNGMSCPSITVCYAPGNSSGNAVVYKSSDGGQSWSTESLPGDLGGFDGYGFLTCPSTAECFEPDPDLAGVLTTTDGGNHWSIESLPASSDGQVACSSTANCYLVVSGDSSVMVTQNGGQHWAIAVLPGGDQLFGTMSCPSLSTCFALTQSSSTVATTTNGGTSWQNEQLPSGGQELGISCASAEFCAATNETEAFYTTDGGEIWSSGSVPTGVAFMYGVQCPSTTTCYAEGQPVFGGPVEPVVTTDGGLTWSTQVLPDGLSLGDPLDCPSATACFGPDLSGSIVTNAAEADSG
jgi:photosystem II stability/assembly factor-like uncharacterized protein